MSAHILPSAQLMQSVLADLPRVVLASHLDSCLCRGLCVLGLPCPAWPFAEHSALLLTSPAVGLGAPWIGPRSFTLECLPLPYSAGSQGVSPQVRVELAGRGLVDSPKNHEMTEACLGRGFPLIPVSQRTQNDKYLLS